MIHKKDKHSEWLDKFAENEKLFKEATGVVQAIDKKASLGEQLDGAKYVKHDPNGGFIYAWYGGHQINIFTEDGQEIDVFNVGDFAEDSADYNTVVESIEDRIAYDPIEELTSG